MSQTDTTKGPQTTAARKVVDYVRAHPNATTAEIMKATGVKSKHTAIDWKRYAAANPKPVADREPEVDEDEVDDPDTVNDDPKGDPPPVDETKAADFDKTLPAKKPAQKKK